MASLETPPAGGDRNKAPAFATITILVSVVATVSVVARLYVRSRVIRQVGMDDVIITIALVSVAHPILSEYLGCLTPFLDSLDCGHSMRCFCCSLRPGETPVLPLTQSRVLSKYHPSFEVGIRWGIFGIFFFALYQGVHLPLSAAYVWGNSNLETNTLLCYNLHYSDESLKYFDRHYNLQAAEKELGFFYSRQVFEFCRAGFCRIL